MTFIEVLVALFVLVTGVLGAVAMQTTAKKGSFDALQRSIASSLAQDIIERMRNNDADAVTLEGYEGVYGASSETPPSPLCETEATACNSAQMRQYDLYEWTEMIRGGEAILDSSNVGGLVNALGCIEHTNQVVTITIVWDGRTETTDGGESGCGSTSLKRRQIKFTSYIF